MREDDYTRDEAGARDHAAILGASEWIGGGDWEREPGPLLAPDARLRPDPWGDVGPVHHPTRFDLPIPAEPPF